MEENKDHQLTKDDIQKPHLKRAVELKGYNDPKQKKFNYISGTVKVSTNLTYMLLNNKCNEDNLFC